MKVHPAREKYAQALAFFKQGKSVVEASKEAGISTAQFYNFRSIDKRKTKPTTRKYAKRPKVIELTPAPRVQARHLALFVGTSEELMHVLRGLN